MDMQPKRPMNIKKPYLECPYCKQQVLTLEQRAFKLRSFSRKCPFCHKKYRVPIWCQILQLFILVGSVGVMLWCWATAKRNILSTINCEILDKIVFFLITAGGLAIVYYVGAKLAYVAPLEEAE